MRTPCGGVAGTEAEMGLDLSSEKAAEGRTGKLKRRKIFFYFTFYMNINFVESDCLFL